MSDWDRLYKMSFASVYSYYVAKAEKKGRTRAEVDEIIRWLTGYSQEQLEAMLADGTDFRTFIEQAPRPNPARDHGHHRRPDRRRHPQRTAPNHRRPGA